MSQQDSTMQTTNKDPAPYLVDKVHALLVLHIVDAQVMLYNRDVLATK